MLFAACRQLTESRGATDIGHMSSMRLAFTFGLLIPAVAFGGWRMLIPGADPASKAASDSVAGVTGQVTEAYFTAAEATLAEQQLATGSYAGAAVQPPITLVRADESSYCVQLDRAPLLQHVNGPGGVPTPGTC
jgi:hypothetical protein